MMASRFARKSAGLNRAIASALHACGSLGACGIVAVDVRGEGTAGAAGVAVGVVAGAVGVEAGRYARTALGSASGAASHSDKGGRPSAASLEYACCTYSIPSASVIPAAAIPIRS